MSGRHRQHAAWPAKAKGVTLSEYASTWLAQRSLKHRTKAHYEVAAVQPHRPARWGAWR